MGNVEVRLIKKKICMEKLQKRGKDRGWDGGKNPSEIKAGYVTNYNKQNNNK